MFVEVKYPYLCRWLRLFLRLHFLLLLELFQLFSLLSFLLQLGFCFWWAWRRKQRKSGHILHTQKKKYSWTVPQEFPTISWGISRINSRTGISSSIHLWCNWHHLLTKTDLPQNLQKLWLIYAGCEPPGNVGQDLPVWWLQRLKRKE